MRMLSNNREARRPHVTRGWISSLLFACVFSGWSAQDASSTENTNRPRVPLMGDAKAWQRLGILPHKEGTKLPAWARALATPLPGTTIAMLQLDYLHRVQTPLGRKLQAKLRWTAAKANRCQYAERYSLADLKRNAATASEVTDLMQGKGNTVDETAAITFAQQLTKNGAGVRDEQVASLIRAYDASRVMAMVQLIAYANFQDRLLHALGLADFDDPHATPAKIKRRGDTTPPLVPRRSAPAKTVKGARVTAALKDWQDLSFKQLQTRLDAQRDRKSRIRIPTADDVRKKFGGNRGRVRWTVVCMYYQPQLARAWFRAMGTFGQESNPNRLDRIRVLEETIFWVITRSIECFY